MCSSKERALQTFLLLGRAFVLFPRALPVPRAWWMFSEDVLGAETRSKEKTVGEMKTHVLRTLALVLGN